MAGAQHGVVSRAQLLATGWSPAAISRGAAAGRLHRVHRGVYAVGLPAATRDAERAAALLALASGDERPQGIDDPGGSILLGSWSAGELWRIVEERDRLVHVTVVGPGRAVAGVVVHRSRRLHRLDRTTCRGFAVTGLARTLLDLAPLLTPRALERAVGNAQYHHALDEAQLRAVLARTPGHRGQRALRALDIVAASRSRTASGLEEDLHAIVAASSLPASECNAPVRGASGRWYRADRVWPDARVIAEADGPHHDRTRFRIDDRTRANDLANAGWTVLRFAEAHLARPTEVVATIARQIAGASALRTAPVARNGGRSI